MYKLYKTCTKCKQERALKLVSFWYIQTSTSYAEPIQLANSDCL